MSARWLRALGLLVMLATVQGCALTPELAEIFERLTVAAGMAPPEDAPQACERPSLMILPGNCTNLPNPCGIDWFRGDAFSLDAPPDWLTVVTETAAGESPRRDLCVALGAAPVLDLVVPFTYVGADPQGGELVITTVSVLDVNPFATATPSTVAFGRSTQLDVEVAGGQPPYHFAWVQFDPAESFSILDDPTRRNPIATITARPQFARVGFRVTVTDGVGQVGEAEVRVEVGVPSPLRVTATATPSTIDFGNTSQLLATIEGGAPPYNVLWTPFSLDSVDILNPVALVGETTEFQVRVLDQALASATANVTVTVVPPPPLADLAVTLLDGPDPVTVGQPLTFSVQVTNHSSVPAFDILLFVEAPREALAVASAVPTAGRCSTPPSGAQLVSCFLDRLAGGATVAITVAATPLTTGTTTTTAGVLFNSSRQTDPDPTNNTATQTTEVVPALPTGQADLTLQVTDSPDPVSVNNFLALEFTVQNVGPDDATNVVLTVGVPNTLGVVLVSPGQGASCTPAVGQIGDTLTCNLGTIPAGSIAAVAVSGTPSVLGSITTMATVQADQADPVPANNTRSQTTQVVEAPGPTSPTPP